MKKNPCVLIALAHEESYERLIKAGVHLAKKYNLEVQAISVQFGKNAATPDPERLEVLHRSCKAENVPMTVYFNNAPDLIVATHARQENAQVLVTGFPKNGESSILGRVRMYLPDTVIAMVGEDEKIYNMIPSTVKERQTATTLKP